jgi:hypothetical protein
VDVERSREKGFDHGLMIPGEVSDDGSEDGSHSTIGTEGDIFRKDSTRCFGIRNSFSAM